MSVRLFSPSEVLPVAAYAVDNFPIQRVAARVMPDCKADAPALVRALASVFLRANAATYCERYAHHGERLEDHETAVSDDDFRAFLVGPSADLPAIRKTAEMLEYNISGHDAIRELLDTVAGTAAQEAMERQRCERSEPAPRPRHIDAAEVAKMIRRDLRAVFGRLVKFSVRTARYAGGSSIFELYRWA
mgnify:CR=1 FL=1